MEHQKTLGFESTEPLQTDFSKAELTAPSQEPEIPLSRIDLNALWIIKRLRAKGFQAYLAGGCVRDLLLGKDPKDFDVATDAKPEEVKRIFRNCRLIGRRFLLAHIFFPGGKIIETATFRANPMDLQEDLPEDLLVTHDNVYGTIEEDARRRDLTVNGLFYDPLEGKIIDYVGGRTDLASQLIRSIGNPHIRFQEDPVRIMRSIRFAARLNFTIESETLAAMKKYAHDISRCAPARIQEELLRLLSGGHSAACLKMCQEVGLLEVLMPELTEGLSLDLLLPTHPNPASQESTPEPLAVPPALSQHTRQRELESLLGALDKAAQKGTDVPISVAFAALLLPVYRALEISSHNERHWIDKLCINWSQRIRLTRRDQDRIRTLLSAISLFDLNKTKEKPALYIIRKPWFKEALLLYILHLHSEASSLEPIGIWKALAQEMRKPYKQDKKGQIKIKPSFHRKRSQGRLPWSARKSAPQKF